MYICNRDMVVELPLCYLDTAPTIIPLCVSNEEMYPHFYMDFLTKNKEAEPIVLWNFH